MFVTLLAPSELQHSNHWKAKSDVLQNPPSEVIAGSQFLIRPLLLQVTLLQVIIIQPVLTISHPCQLAHVVQLMSKSK
jgi:hypothetical protein